MKVMKVKAAQLCLILCDPMDYTVHGILQARILEWVAFPFSRGSSQPRDRTLVSHIAGGFFTSWATREAQECWSGKIQWIFPIQESKWGLLYCRQILYQLSYQGSPSKMENNVGDLGSVPGLGRSPGEGKDYPLQCSGLENSMDCIVHRITKSRTQLSDFHFHRFHAYSIH